MQCPPHTKMRNTFLVHLAATFLLQLASGNHFLLEMEDSTVATGDDYDYDKPDYQSLFQGILTMPWNSAHDVLLHLGDMVTEIKKQIGATNKKMLKQKTNKPVWNSFVREYKQIMKGSDSLIEALLLGVEKFLKASKEEQKKMLLQGQTKDLHITDKKIKQAVTNAKTLKKFLQKPKLQLLKELGVIETMI